MSKMCLERYLAINGSFQSLGSPMRVKMVSQKQSNSSSEHNQALNSTHSMITGKNSGRLKRTVPVPSSFLKAAALMLVLVC